MQLSALSHCLLLWQSVAPTELFHSLSTHLATERENYIYLNWNLAMASRGKPCNTSEIPCYTNAKRTISTKKHQPQFTQPTQLPSNSPSWCEAPSPRSGRVAKQRELAKRVVAKQQVCEADKVRAAQLVPHSLCKQWTVWRMLRR